MASYIWFFSPGVQRTVYTKVGCIMASWFSPQVRKCQLNSSLYLCLTNLSFFRVPLQATLDIHDHSQWQVSHGIFWCFFAYNILLSYAPHRFKTDTRLCLSISDYHPDTWNPAWSVSTILTGGKSLLLSSIVGSLYFFS